MVDKDQEPDCLLMRLAVDNSGEEQGEQEHAGKNKSHIQMLPDRSSVSVNRTQSSTATTIR